MDSAKNGEYYIDMADFRTCALKNTFQNKFKAFCEINEEKKESDLLSLTI
ncbi:hypothetical protein [Campylobacter subantarcticus]|nr:hypothetical protein [Campylobacter subantarcticus]